MICAALVQHLLQYRLVSIHALHLIKRPFVVIQIQPGHPVQDRLHRFLRGTLQIGILDAQNEGAAQLARVGP